MKKAIVSMLACTLLTTLSAHEEEMQEKAYPMSQQAEGMCINNGEIFVVSSFTDADHLTAYTVNGVWIWNVKFTSKMISWQVFDHYIFVFTKDKYGRSTYITCLDRHTGLVIWQRP